MKNFYRRGLYVIVFLLLMAALVIISLSQAKAATLNSFYRNIQQEIKGRVTNQKGDPLLGVTVLVKNRQYGTTTNRDGNFSLNASANDTLVFSSIGYKRQEIPLQGRTNIDVQLEEDIAALGEVEINAGYYNVTERERTGNISRVTAEEIEGQPVLNPLAAIQGRMPGVEITQATGVPGGAFDIKIRGTNSLRSDGNNPLYIIDGVPFSSTPVTDYRIIGAQIETNPLSSINPSDIESIEVLKDADATAIYGSRGANGVVLITTKTGKAGKTEIHVDVSSGVGEVAHFQKLLHTPEYLNLRREAYENAGATPTAAGAPDLTVWDDKRYTNWQKELIGKTARLHNVQSSISGGTENLNFRSSFGFREETTVFPGDFSNRKFSGGLSLNHLSRNKKFQVSLSSLYSVDNSSLPKLDLTLNALTLPPNAPSLYDEEGKLNWENSTWNNPLAVLEEKYKGRVNNLLANAVLKYEVLDGLEIKGSAGYTNTNTNQLQTTPSSAFNPALTYNQRASNRNNTQIETWILEPQLNYHTEFGDFGFESLIGASLQETNRKSDAINATGFASDELLENLQAASSFRIINSGEIQYKYRAVFGRVHLDYKDKYLLNFTGRRDGSSRFGPGREYGNFGAIGVGWLFSEEEFFKNNTSFLNFGKLRFSYGTTGNDQIGDYQFMDQYSPSYYSYGSQSGLNPVRIANPEFGWETNRKLESGLELELLDSRIGLSASYFKNKSSNQLVGFPLPGSTGFTSVQYNFPATVTNTGYEFLLRTRNISMENFSWESSFNISFPKNRLEEYDNFEASPYANVYSIGKPLSILRSFDYQGVNPETGVYDFRDINGDGFISYPDDIVDIADFDPDYFGGFRNNFTYKNWNLDFFFQFIKRKSRSYYGSFQSPGSRSNQPAEVVDRWQNPGDENPFQMASVGFNNAFFSYMNVTGTSFNVTDASYLRLKNLSLSYSLPEITGLHSRIYFQGQNLLTFTRFKGLDPENAGRTQVPPLRFYAVGLEINL